MTKIATLNRMEGAHEYWLLARHAPGGDWRRTGEVVTTEHHCRKDGYRIVRLGEFIRLTRERKQGGRR